MKGIAFLALKLAIAAVLVGWLLHAGTLDFGALRLLFESPELLVATLASLAFCIVIGALRWRLLLQIAGVSLSVGRAVALQLTGLFFNIAIPGGIGGDVVKAVYVARDAPPASRPVVYLIGVVDRLCGAASLVVVAVGAVLLRGKAAWEIPELRELTIVVAVLAILSLGTPLVILALLRRSGDSAVRSMSPLSRFVGHVVEAGRLIAARPGVLAVALVLAAALHLAGAAVFVPLAKAISTHEAPLASVLTVYPLGMLTVMIPISYAGIGVGHLAFERLFSVVGMTDGASVFNVYFIAQTAPCLLGVIPYLMLRRGAAPPTQAEAALQQAGMGR